MKRPVFQDGRVLRTSDFVDEQAYHLAEHRRHNRTNHVWGIASGLRVVLSDGDLVVEPGCAVDGFGRDVVLETNQALDLHGFKIRGIEAVDVWAVYNRIRIPAAERIPPAGDGVDLLVDSAGVEVTDAADFDPREPPGVTQADLASAATQPPRRWPVYLGRITRDLAHPETAPNIELDRRPYIGLVGATVDTSEQFTWLEFSDGDNPAVSVKLPRVDDEPPTVFEVSAYEGVKLNNRLTVDGELAVRSGSLSLTPAEPALVRPAAGPPEWSLSLAENPKEEEGEEVSYELRVAMPKTGSETVPNKLVVGVWRDDNFVPGLVINETGTVMIAGNLIISGYLKASSVQESQPSEEAKAYLAGLRAVNLLTLFQTVTPPASD